MGFDMTTLATGLDNVLSPSLAPPAFPTSPSLPTFPALPAFMPRPLLQKRTDTLIAQNRAETPAETTEQRAVSRSSIAELNALDFDSIRDRFQRTRHDTRPPLIKFLDLIDLPRNALFNLVAPGIAARKKAEGEEAAFGLGRVFASDVLREMGVRNKVIRGVVGFIGDVVFDPLTYLGPAGFGIKATARTGLTVALTGSGKRSIRRGLKAVRAGGPVVDPQTARLFDSLTLGKEFKTLGARADSIAQALTGSGKRSKISVLTGADVKVPGGVIAERLTHISGDLLEGPQREAVKEFVARFGRASSPGVAIGRGGAFEVAATGAGRIVAGSQIMHVPFTDIGLRVPAFTSAGRTAERNRALALARPSRGIDAIASPPLREATVRHAKAAALMAKSQTVSDELFDAIDEIAAGSRAPGVDIGVTESGVERMAMLRDELKAIGEELKTVAKESTDALLDLDPSRFAQSAESAEDFLHMANLVESHKAAQARLTAIQSEAVLRQARLAKDGEIGENFALAISRSSDELKEASEQAISIAIDAAAKDTEAVNLSFQTAIDLATTTRGSIVNLMTGGERDILRVGKIAMGTDDDMIGASVFAPIESIVRWAFRDSGEVAASHVAELDRQRRRIFGDSPGALKQLLASLRRDTSTGFRAAANRVFADFTEQTRGVLRAHELPESKWDEAAELISLFATEKLAGENPTLFWTKLHGNPSQPSRLAAKLDELRESGLLRQRPGLEKDLRELAEAHIGQYMTMGQLEKDAELLASVNKAYLPLVMEKRAAERAILQLNSIPSASRGGGPSSRLAGREGFQVGPKTTVQYRYVEQPARATQRRLKLAERLRTQIQKATQAQDAETVNRLENRLSKLEESLSGVLTEPTPRVFLEFDRALLGLTDNEILATHGKELGLTVIATRETIKKYDEIVKSIKNIGSVPTEKQRAALGEFITMVDPEAASTMFPNAEARDILDALQARQTDPVDLNAMVAEGALSFLTGDARGAFFDLNADVVLAKRVGMHRLAQSKAVFMEAMASSAATIDARRAVRKLSNDTVEIEGGIRAKVITSADGNQRVVVVAGERYRKINPDRIGTDNPIYDALNLGNESRETLFHEKVADAIEGAAELLGDEARTKQLFRWAEQFTTIWKGVTLAHPSWLMTNILGDGLLAFQAGLNPKTVLQLQGEVDGRKATLAEAWVRVVRRANSPEKQREISLTFGGQTFNGQDLYEQIEAIGTIGTNRGVDALLIFSRDTRIQLKRQGGLGIRGIRDAFLDARDTAAMGRKITSIPGADKAAATGIFVNDRIKTYMSAWYKLNGQISDTQRGLAFISNVEAGMDFTSASEKVVRNMYDYSDLTKTERSLRLLMPFYTFVKNSFVQQSQIMLKRPAYANSFTKLKQNIEEAIVGDAQIPEHLRPAWMREQMAIQIAKDPAKSWAVLPATLLPVEAALQAAQSAVGVDGLQEFANYFLSNTNPLFRAIAEFGAGREFFSGREIGANALEGDISAKEFLLGQFRPLRELGIGGTRQGPLPRAFAQGPLQGAGRLLLGGRIQAFDEERREFALQRQFDEEVRNLRKAINVARREGADRLSLEARAKLLRVYESMLAAGLEGVPKWAQRQLEEIGATEP